MIEELKPCPFCGGQPVLYEIEAHTHSPMIRKFIPDFVGSWYAECCCVLITGRTKKVTEIKWNTRA